MRIWGWKVTMQKWSWAVFKGCNSWTGGRRTRVTGRGVIKKTRGSLVPFETLGISVCLRKASGCQTWVTVIGTAGLGSNIFSSHMSPPQPDLSIPVTRGGNVLPLQVWCSLIHSLPNLLLILQATRSRFLSRFFFFTTLLKNVLFVPLSPVYSLLFSQLSSSSPWTWLAQKQSGRSTPDSFSRLWTIFFDKPPFVGVEDRLSGRVSDKHKTPPWAALSPFLFSVDTLDSAAPLGDGAVFWRGVFLWRVWKNNFIWLMEGLWL